MNMDVRRLFFVLRSAYSGAAVTAAVPKHAPLSVDIKTTSAILEVALRGAWRGGEDVKVRFCPR